MKLIIDINDNEYIGIKEYPGNITSYPVTIHLYDAVRNGTPLEDIKVEIQNTILEQTYEKGQIAELEKIKAESEELKGENK